MRIKLPVSIGVVLLFLNIVLAQTYESYSKIVGVDNQGKGITGNISVEIQPGKGRVLVDTQPLTGIYTQDSERIAVKVTSEITKFNFSQYDVIYTIKTPNANVVEGPSAGSMMTLVTIAAIEGKKISNSFSMTGTIQEDHSIGKIGAVLAKAKAAADSGVTVFLIPEGQALQYEYVKKTKSPSPGWIVETIEPVEVNVIDLAKGWGMEVHEVSTMEEATNYAFGEVPAGKVKKTTALSSITIPLFSSPLSIYKEFEPLSTAAIERAKSSYSEAKNKLDQTVLPDDVKNVLSLLLTRAQQLNNDADAAKDRGYRYSSGNNAFRATINSETVTDLIDYYSLPQEARRNFLINRVKGDKDKIALVKSQIEKQTENAMCDSTKFEWAVAARQRITYAENRVDSIAISEENKINMTSPADILFDINIAEEWVKISKDFVSKTSSNVADGCEEKFKTKANEVLTEARTAVIMSETKGSRATSDGKWFLDAAEKEFSEGWYIAAIYDATSAKVRSEVESEYEKLALTKIYDDFNKFEFVTSDLIGTIFFENAQYSMYAAVRDDDQSQAAEAITLLNLAKEIDAVYNEVKGQLTPGSTEFKFSKDALIVVLVILVVGVLLYVNKLRLDIQVLEKSMKIKNKVTTVKKRKK